MRKKNGAPTAPERKFAPSVARQDIIQEDTQKEIDMAKNEKNDPSSTQVTPLAQVQVPAQVPAQAQVPPTTLPSDKYESQPAPEPPRAELPQVPAELLKQIEAGVKHLLTDPTAWRIPVPMPLDRWQPLRYALLDGGPDEEVQAARDALGDVYFRIYPGFTGKEMMMVVRVPDTTYLRAEVLPWTIGK